LDSSPEAAAAADADRGAREGLPVHAEDPPLLVEPSWLEARLGSPALRVVDGSWYLPEAKRDPRTEFAAAHIPGAIPLDLATDLADLGAPVRNTVAEPEQLAARLGAVGIGRAHEVVVYDRQAGYSAARVWWCLRYAGHDRVSVLDGGFARWQAEGRALASGSAAQHAPCPWSARPEPRWLASQAAVLRALQQGSAQVVDVRSAERFRGEGVEHAPRRGHMPGAYSVPYTEHWTRPADGSPPRFLAAAELRRLYREAGVDLAQPIITTCGSGVTAALAAFALSTAGVRDVRVYDGSWAEWAGAAALPCERGPARRT
jgi:thiosulfate/3-mercaptopyruvate sulfurtransferase